MGTPVYNADGQIVDVDPAEATRGYVEGRFRPSATEGRVAVRFPDGGVGTVDASDVQGTIDDGGSLASTEELTSARQRRQYEQPGQIAQTAVEGAARGATVGLSDVAIGALGGGEEASRRRQYNPGTAVLGELGGAVLPMLIPGVGEANAARIAGEGASLARGAAAAGRAIAAPGRAVAVLGDAGATGGRLAAEAFGLGGEGAGLLSRAGAAALEAGGRGAVEGGITGAGGAISEFALGETPELRADRLLHHIGMGAILGGGASGALGAGGSLAQSLRRALPSIRESESLRLITARSRAEASGLYGKQVLNEIEARHGGIDDFAAQLDELGVGTGLHTPGEGGVTAGTRATPSLPTPAQSDLDAARLLERAGKQFDDVGRVVDTSGSRVGVRGVIARGERLAADARLAPSGGEARARAIEALIDPFRAHADNGLTWVAAQKQKKLWSDQVRQWAASADPQSATLRGLGGQLNDEMKAAAKAAGVGDQWARANLEYGIGKTILDKGGRKSEMGGMGGAFTTGSLTSDIFSGSFMGAGAALGGVPMAVVGGIAGRMLGQEVRRFTPAVKTRALQWLMRANVDTAKAVKGAATGAVAGTVVRAARSAVPRATAIAYDEAVRQVREATPAVIAQRIGEQTQGVAEAAPELHGALATSAVRAQAALERAIPPGDRMRAGELQPHLRRGHPVSESERSRFLEVKRAIDDPRVILDAVRDQTLTPDQAQVLRDVYPELYKDLRTEVMRTISTMTEPIPYQARVRLGVLLNAPTDPTLAPDVVAALQMGYSATAPTTQGPQPPNKPGRSTMSGQFTASEVDNFERRQAAPVG